MERNPAVDDVGPIHSVESRRTSGRSLAPALLLPALLLMAVFLFYPVARLVYISFFDPDPTLRNYTILVESPVYFRIILTTLEVSFLTTVFALLLGYPVAFAMANWPRWAGTILLFVMLPLLTSILVRSFGWMVILGRSGIVNNLLIEMNIVGEPLKLIYNRTGTIIGMTHVLLPFMIMPIYAVMRTIDPALVKAGKSLGAGNWSVFRTIYLPLTAPGVLSGVLLVFIMAVGFFVTPALLGGPSDMLIATLIHSEVQEILNWGRASSLAMMLLLVILLVLVVYQRALGLDRLWRSRN